MFDYRKLFDLTGKKALVVGAGSGIGEAAALGLAAHGAHVLCADLNLEGGQRVTEAIKSSGGSAEAIAFDMRDGEAAKKIVGDLIDLDVSGQHAGDQRAQRAAQHLGGGVRSRDLAQSQGNLPSDYRSGTQHEARGKGSIITFASIRAHTVEPGQGVYAATKAGVLQMCRALAAELGPYGVRVNAIGPGVVETP